MVFVINGRREMETRSPGKLSGGVDIRYKRTLQILMIDLVPCWMVRSKESKVRRTILKF